MPLVRNKLKLKASALTLTLGFFVSVSHAAGTAEFVAMPFEQMVRHLVSKYKVTSEEAEMLASTIIKGTEYSLGRSIPTNDSAALTRLLDQPGNQKLKAAFDAINIKNIDELTEAQIGSLANEIGAVVDQSAKRAVDVCRSCGITDDLVHRFGLRVWIPREVDTSGLESMKDLPLRLDQVLSAIDQEGRGVIKLTRAEITDLMKSQSLNKHDLRKLLFALKARKGEYGPEAEAAAKTFLAMADDKPLTENRMALVIADFVDSGAEGKATLKELADIGKKINEEHKTPKARREALCKHFANIAKGKPAREANFTKLKNCPNYQLVFNSCSI
jgi:hypothetical protein